MATYAIGDVQGCFDALQALLEQVEFNATRDCLWFVGDLVNRGPQSLEVLRFVRGLGEAAVTVLGNHDLHLVMVAEGYGRHHAEDTLEPVLAAPDRAELVEWLRRRPMLHGEEEYLMVHAGLLPRWDAARARDLAAEVEEALAAADYPDFLAHMWGSEPTRWDESLRGWDRLRVIVNAMTRMRFCTIDGVMEFRVKGPPERPPADHIPWYEVPGRASARHTVICGHWSALGFRQQAGLLALDSGCLWGGSLTAVRLEDRRVFQCRCPCAVKPSGWQ
ncbi:MAG: symmetrical bis(5'-nucleosyl)-tetraphosphatase [Betaproteobacteria bacterium]|nr:symmetrical bis(5'-nucleosyl)-tetraphosphatase [Betaproteobacteria bacterium]